MRGGLSGAGQNELGYLSKLARISSVSGGSIMAGVLGLKWSKLAFGAVFAALQVEWSFRSTIDETL